MSSTFLFVVPY